MIKVFYKILAIITIVFASSICLGEETQKGSLDSILATVNGTPIILSEIIDETLQEETIIINSFPAKKAEELIKELRLKVVESRIEKALILDEYNRKPFTIPDSYISDYIDDIAKSTGVRSRREFYKKLREMNVDIDKFKVDIKNRIIVQFCVGRESYSQVNISPKRLYEYYNENIKAQPNSYLLYVIFIDKTKEDATQRKDELEKELKENSNTFPFLADKYSDLKNDLNLGVGYTSADNIREEFKPFIQQNADKTGVISDLIETDDGYYYVYVGAIKTFDRPQFKDVEQKIKKELEKLEQQKLYDNYIKKLKENAIIEYYF